MTAAANTNNHAEAKIDALIESIGDLREATLTGFARLEEREQHQRKRLDDLEATTYGNGTPGLKMRVGLLEQRVESDAKAQKEHRDSLRWYATKAIAAMAVAATIVVGVAQVVARWIWH